MQRSHLLGLGALIIVIVGCTIAQIFAITSVLREEVKTETVVREVVATPTVATPSAAISPTVTQRRVVPVTRTPLSPSPTVQR